MKEKNQNKQKEKRNLEEQRQAGNRKREEKASLSDR